MRMLSVPGHFGELLQGRLGPEGPVALMTLPLPLPVIAAQVTGPGAAVAGPLPPPLARGLLRRLGLGFPGRVLIRARLPVGGGAGCSTAALVALARLAGWRGDPMDLARACVAVEGASDPLMLPGAGRLLWASREGRVLGAMPPLARCEIVGGFFGPPQATRDAGAFADISDLIAGWRAADLPRQAALASESAARRWGDDRAAQAARALGALGWTAAHTGSARGLIFRRGAVPPCWRAALLAAGGRSLLRFRVGGE
ncbi:hypothetical protein [Paracoccus contaminans]|uniref:Propanediol utilization protein n=1 Tax=Paracoccus contaminans TaxID=1945662 RepID=A0A1W6CVY9_9RHOB|nr:hypothetical protein [Paracoccus contaminans]ARJ68995.1 hypothetical protein B0A89_04475 [Paracoccus contaminans]